MASWYDTFNSTKPPKTSETTTSTQNVFLLSDEENEQNEQNDKKNVDLNGEDGDNVNVEEDGDNVNVEEDDGNEDDTEEYYYYEEEEGFISKRDTENVVENENEDETKATKPKDVAVKFQTKSSSEWTEIYKYQNPNENMVLVAELATNDTSKNKQFYLDREIMSRLTGEHMTIILNNFLKWASSS